VKKQLAILLFLLLSCDISAQNRRSYHPLAKDPAKMMLYKNRLASFTISGQTDSLAWYYKIIADSYYALNISDSSLYYISLAVKQYEKLNDSFYIWYGRFRMNDAEITSGRLRSETLTSLYEAARYYEKHDENIMAINCHFVISKYHKLSANKKFSEIHLEKAFLLNTEVKDTSLQLILLQRKWQDLADEKKWSKAASLAEELSVIASSFGSEHFLKVATKLSGISFYQLGDYENAVIQLKKSLELSSVQYRDHIQAAAYLVNSYLKMGKEREAEKSFSTFQRIRDSISVLEQNDNYKDLLVKYETEKKQAALSALENENRISAINSARQRLMIYLLAGLMIVIVVVSIIAIRNIRKRQQLEKLNELRSKISRDLHDEVGATLTSISFLSEVARQKAEEKNPSAVKILDRIGENSRDMIGEINDIVWSINPSNDKFDKIADRMKNFALPLLSAKSIKFEFIADNDLAAYSPSMEQRKNLYLVFKEAVNNAVKYSGCSRIVVRFGKNKNAMLLSIADDGAGFDPHELKDGNGLKNMELRAREINAKFQIRSAPGNGTCISLQIRLTQNADIAG
jgi:signal transduction histidine kinase